MRIDCHTHLGEADGRNYGPEELLRSMDVAGIDQSIIIAERTSASAAFSTMPTTTS